MNLVMFTPVAAASAIGRVARMVCRALTAKGHQVTVVRTEDPAVHAGQLMHDFGTPVIDWQNTEQVRAALANSDTAIYQVGDTYLYHQGVLPWLAAHPGVVCLHDYFLGHLFRAWFADGKGRREQAQQILCRLYGDQVAAQFLAAGSSSDLIATIHDKAPMTEWIASMAGAVVTHSSWAIDRVLKSCAGPVRTLALPYELSPAAVAVPAPAAGSPQDTVAAARKFRILTVGHVNPNKRVASVIRAIGQSSLLRESAHYDVAGGIEPHVAAELKSLAAGLKVSLTLHGQVEDGALHELIRQASAMACLRMPTLEAASASAIEAMLAGKATVVLDTGFFADLPDDVVRKVSPDDELVGLTARLEALCQDEPACRALGERARAWATQTFNATRYAEGLEQVCEDLHTVMPILGVVQAYSATLRGWGADASMLVEPQLVEPLKLFSISPG